MSGGAGRQYVCTGYVGTGSVPASGGTTSVVFTITTNSTLTWKWGTEFYLDTGAGTGGSVDVDDGWHSTGTVVVITATPTNGYDFTT